MGFALSFLLSVPVLLLGFFVLRLGPIWRTRHQGCDAYYFLLCAESFRDKRRLPIILPKLYMMESEEQWYPPLFSVLCSLIPKGWLERNYWLPNHLFDAIPLLLLFTWASFNYGLGLGITAAVAYAGAGPLVVEYRGLNSRAMAAILFVAYMFSSFYASQGSWTAFIFTVIFGVFLLYTHKLSVQLLLFLVLFMALVQLETAWLWPLVTAYGVALVIGRGLFIKILRAHADIVAFWNRNWRWLGAHQVRQSPVYGDGKVDTSVYAGGSSDLMIRNAKQLLHHNYFIIMVLWALPSLPTSTLFERFLMLWVFGTYVWASATLFLPHLRCLGYGTQYVKYAYLPSVMITVGILARAANPVPWVVAVICLALTIRYYFVMAGPLWRGDPEGTGLITPELNLMIERIRSMSSARVLCIPLHLSDTVAYYARSPVLWGTHGYGFHRIEPLFPVFLRPIGDFVRDYSLTHLLLDRRYATLEELHLPSDEVVEEIGDFILFRFDEGSDRLRNHKTEN
jgi:hypothetical protein